MVRQGMQDRVLFVEDEFDVLDPIVRRLSRKEIQAEIADYDSAEEHLSNEKFRHVVFDQLFPGERLGTRLYGKLRRGDYGPKNMRVKCAFYTALSREEVLRHLAIETPHDSVRVVLKSEGLGPLYDFLEVAELTPAGRSRARTIVEIVQISDDGRVVQLIVPGWRSDINVSVALHRLPAVIRRELKEGPVGGRLYTAEANLGAEKASELALDEFDILKER